MSSSSGGSPTLSHRVKQSWIEVLLRALGLSLVWNAWSKLLGRPKTEKPKQALRFGRMIAFLSLTTHFVPMIGAIMIMALNFRGYYIGSELSGPEIDNEVKLSGLQFTAKLHELMMQASLSLVVVSFIRHELVRGQGIPFGAIFASVQFANPDYLWSKEFAGTLKARFQSKATKWGLAFLVVLNCIVFSVVGPSSAIAMRPRLGEWAAGGTYFYLNASKDQIWPSTLDGSNVLPNFTRPWGVISDSMMPFWPQLSSGTSFPDEYKVPSEKSMKTLYTRQTVGLFKAPWTAATTQMSNLADAMTDIGYLWINAAFQENSVPGRHYSSRFKFRKDVTWSIKDIYRPLTQVACITHRGLDDNDIAGGKLFAPNVETFCPGVSTELYRQINSFTDTSQIKAVLANYNDSSSSSPVLEFVDLPANIYGENSIGAFVSLPPSWPGGQALVTCAVNARWEPAVIKGTRSAVKVVTGQSDRDDQYADRGACMQGPTAIINATTPWPPPTHWPDYSKEENIFRIKVTKEWANQLNPSMEDSNQTAIHEILGSVPEHHNGNWSDGTGFVSPVTESVLSVLITNGLASTAYDAVPQGILKGCTANKCNGICEDGNGAWCKAIMPTYPKEFGYGSEIFDLPANTDTSKWTQFRVQVDINGYAYYWRDTTVILSCVVLGIYCLIALSHILFSLITGLTSQSWDTISEIVALAMQSQPSEALRNTSAGIVTTSIFKNFVRVGKTGEKGEHLELIFENEENDGAGVVKVEVDEFYE